MAQLRPCNDQVIAKVIPGEAQSVGGVVIPDRSQKPVSQQAIVYAVGRGTLRKKTGQIIPVGVNIGDRILYRDHGMIECMIDGEFYVFIRANDVLAVLD